MNQQHYHGIMTKKFLRMKNVAWNCVCSHSYCIQCICVYVCTYIGDNLINLSHSWEQAFFSLHGSNYHWKPHWHEIRGSPHSCFSVLNNIYSMYEYNCIVRLLFSLSFQFVSIVLLSMYRNPAVDHLFTFPIKKYKQLWSATFFTT
jgi:hypothetical protein